MFRLLVRALVSALAVSAALTCPPAARAQSLPPVECVEALRSARNAGLAGDAEGAGRRAEAALALPGCELPALLAVLDLTRQGIYSPQDAPALRRRLLDRLADPGAAVPSGTLSYLARPTGSHEDDQGLLAALETRRTRAETTGPPLSAEALRETLQATLDLADRLGQLETARAAVSRLLATEDREEWRWRALTLDLRLERWESAERLLAKMTSAPGASDALTRLHALTLARLGRYDEMTREIDRLAPQPGPPAEDGVPPAPFGSFQSVAGTRSLVDLLEEAGWALRDAGRDAEAEALFRRALALAPNDEQAHLVLLHLYGTPEERAQHAAAVSAKRDAMKDPDALFREGTTLLSSGDNAGALDLLARAAPALGGSSVEDAAWYNLGLAAFRLERWQQAAEAFTHAVILDDGRADAHFQLGLALYHLERCGEALAPLRRALELAPEKYQAHYFLAHCYSKLGQLQAAKREQEIYRKAAPPR